MDGCNDSQRSPVVIVWFDLGLYTGLLVQITTGYGPKKVGCGILHTGRAVLSSSVIG